MNRFTFISLLFFGLYFGLNPSPARAVDPWLLPKTVAPSPWSQISQPLIMEQAVGIGIDHAHRVWVESEQVSTWEDGGIRSFRLKSGVDVTRSEFIPRYRLNLGLGKDDTIVEHNVLDLPKVGWVVSRHRQQYKGLEVLGAEYVLQEKEGRVEWAAGKFAIGLDLDVTHQITEAAALEFALKDVGAEVYDWEADPEKNLPPKGVLAIASKDYQFTKESFRLVYRFIVSCTQPFNSYTVDVDAKTGEVVKFSNIVYDNVPSKGATYYNGPQAFFADQEQYLEDGDEKITYSLTYVIKMTNAEIMVLARDFRKPNMQGAKEGDLSFIDSDDDNYFGDEEDKVGVSAFWGVQKALEYYKNRFAWIGFDGVGKPSYPDIPLHLIDIIVSTKVIGAACYDPVKRDLLFSAEATTPLLGPPVGLDIVGHEFAHGIVAHTSNLIYKAEPAALNEGFGDIFGDLLEFYVEGPNGNWIHGEDSNAGYCRSAMNPKEFGFPDTYKGLFYQDTSDPCNQENDYCGAHKNSTVLSHWFYLLVTGGTGANDNKESFFVTGIGMEKAEKIAFLTMVSLPPTAQFMDARLLSLQIAESLYGLDSPEQIAVANAWYAVGVGDPHQVSRTYQPASGTTNVESWTPPVKLGWSVLPDEYEWKVEVATDPNFSQIVLEKTATAVTPGAMGQRIFQSALNADTSYFWRVSGKRKPGSESSEDAIERAPDTQSRKTSGDFLGKMKGLKEFFQLGGHQRSPQQSGGVLAGTSLATQELIMEEEHDWSPVQYFRTASKRPAIESPKGGSDTHPWEAVVTYKPVPGATGYVVQIVENPDQFSPRSTGDALSKSSELQQTLKLKMNTDYWWRVMALGPKDADGKDTFGDWSSEHGTQFKTSVPRTALNAPANKVSTHPWGIELTGGKVKGAEKYRVVVSKTTDLTGPVFDSGEISEPKATIPGLGQYNAPYFWGIYPYDQDKNEWGTTQKWEFTADYNKTKPKLIKPASYKFYYKVKLPYSWKRIQGASHYKLAVYHRVNGTAGPLAGEEIIQDSLWAEGVEELEYGFDKYSSDKNGYCCNLQSFGPNNLTGLTSDWACYDIVPPPPTLLEPGEKAQNVNYQPTQFKWACDLCKEYSADTSFVLHTSVSSQPETGFTASRPELQPGTTYEWWVEAYAPHLGLYTSSQKRTFTTKPKPAPKEEQAQQPTGDSCPPLGAGEADITFPGNWSYADGNHATKAPGTPKVTFSWNPVSGATKYQVEISKAGIAGTIATYSYSGKTQSDPILHNYYTGYIVNVRAGNNCTLGAIEGKGRGYYLIP